MVSSAIGRFVIGLSPIGLPDSKESRMTPIYGNETVISMVTLSGTLGGVALPASGVLAGDLVVQAFDLTSGSSVLALLAPRVPADGLVMQVSPAPEPGHLALLLLRRKVLIEQVVELVSAT